MERRAKLFEEIDSTQGDVSFQSTMPNNGRNRLALGFPGPDLLIPQGAIVNNSVLSNDSGTAVYFGSILVERCTREWIHWSFFSGNSNWIAELTGDLQTLNLSRYDIVQNATNVVGSWDNTEGLIFPFCDPGVLTERRSPNLRPEDFIPGLYLHTVMQQLFQAVGIKLKGDLITNGLFRKIVVLTVPKSEKDIDSRSVKIQKNAPLTLLSDADYRKLHFDIDNIYPYYNGGRWDMTDQKFIADIAMDVQVKVTTNLSGDKLNFLGLDKNGTLADVIANPWTTYYQPASVTSGKTNTLSVNIHLEPGDYFAVYARNSISGGPSVNVVSAILEAEPTFLYKAIASATLPKWTKQQFVSNVLQLFNCVTYFEPLTKVLTINFFDRIMARDAIDLSKYVRIYEEDYVDFVSEYGKNNLFKYQEANDEEIKKYNVSAYLKYGSGVVKVQNEFIQDTVDVITSDFTAPISYINSTFGASMERLDLLSVEEHNDRYDFTGVEINATWGAQFMFAGANLFFEAGQLIRIESEGNVQYNGDWTISSVTSTYFTVYNGQFLSDTPGRFSKLKYTYQSSDEAFLLVHTGLRDIDEFSTLDSGTYYMLTSSRTTLGFSFFNLLRNGVSIESQNKQGLSFGGVANDLSYQKTLIDTFWQNFKRMLNNPVKLLCSATLPDHVHRQIDFLTPVYITTVNSSNTYYVNRVTGYQGSEEECEIELIKLP